jgi:1,4-dihydroxy-2-naphthoate octaprenyltransferase
VNPNRTLLTGGSGALGPGKLPRRVALMAATVCLALLASFTVLLMATGALTPVSYTIMALAFLGAFFYSTPPVHLEASGYGELTSSVLVGLMVPGFAFALQEGELHRLIAMVGFPLVASHLAMLVAFSLPDYSNDEKFEKRTLLVRMGWQTAMFLHNVMILAAFVVLLGARAFGFPTFAAVAGLLSLPVGLFQIWQMNRIANGAPVRWNVLTIGAAAQFILLAYMLAFAFWTN